MDLVPMVIKREPNGERAYDIFSRLLEERIIFLGGSINDDVANVIIAQLLFLDNENSEADISFYINSPGGYVHSTLAIYDTMKFIRADVSTFCIGMAASGAAVLLAGGKAGKRLVLPNSKIMIHQPLGGIEGQATDIQIHAEEMLKMKRRLNEILAKETGKKPTQVEKDTERDFFMNAAEAKNYGIIDKILEERQVEKSKKDG